jgi:hypothetical protein
MLQTLDNILAKWEPARQASAAAGHDISHTTISRDLSGNGGAVRVADDGGAYEYRQGLIDVLRFSIGCPSKATEDICDRIGR